MVRDFDLYLVSVDWESENKIRIFTPSALPLEPSEIDEKMYHYDMVIYNKIDVDYYQLAIKSKMQPKLDSVEKTFDSSLFLIPGTEYWILKGEWSTSASNRKYHHCPSINTVGRLTFTVKDLRIEVDLNPNIEGFDFNALKIDFEGELWNLLTSYSSKAKVQAREIKFGGMKFNLANSQFIIAFIKEFEKIIKKPKRDLKYAVHNLPFDRVRPIPATYSKLALSGTNVLLPSKSFVDNYDNYENRYLCFMLNNIYNIVQYKFRFSLQQVVKIISEIESINNKILELEKPHVINKEQVREEINAQQKKIIEKENIWKNISKKLDYNKSNCYELKSVTIWKQHNKRITAYWANIPEFCLITFPAAISSNVTEGSKYKMEVNVKPSKSGITSTGKNYIIFEENDIKSIEDMDVEEERNILKKQMQNYTLLDNNNWLLSAIFNPTELKKVQIEKTNQIATLGKRKESIEKQLSLLSEFRKEIQQFNPILIKLLKSEFVEKINFRKILRLQPSMTFIQNIQYRNALMFYREFLNAEGLELSIFDFYEQITNYGIREMPQVYELWTLISIISVLENTFSYKHRPSDMINLLNNIAPQNRKLEISVEIGFTGELNERKIVLHYQRKLANGKRPDILLEISCRSRKIFIVLDAKYKNYNYKISAVNEAQKMVNKYRINSEYYVFILHPCKDITNNNKTTKLTNFGGERIFVNGEQVEHPFHNFGYLMIKPNETDNLKKVIGMAFEYLVESTHNSKKIDRIIDPLPEHKMICIVCGGSKTTTSKFSRDINRYYYTCKCENKDCGHEISIDYCWNCKTNLFKHGSYWDYHRTSVWSVFDIHCPKCGMTLADRPNIKH